MFESTSHTQKEANLRKINAENVCVCITKSNILKHLESKLLRSVSYL